MDGELFGALSLFELTAIQRKIEMAREMEMAREIERGVDVDSKGKLEIEI
jgi:hypothetical protein